MPLFSEAGKGETIRREWKGEVFSLKAEIIYEDEAVIVCYKPAGIAVQTRRVGQMDVESELKNYLKGTSLYVVHRLDQPVEGVMVFAKNKETAAALGAQLGSGTMSKDYVAVVYGRMAKDAGESVLTDYLKKEPKGNYSRVVDETEEGARIARLSYRVWGEKKVKALGKEALANADDVLTLLDIRLLTGRHHQIRVQLAHAGNPLLADNKYAGDKVMQLSEQLGVRNIALCAHRIQFVHPSTKQKMMYEITPKGLSFQYFCDILINAR